MSDTEKIKLINEIINDGIGFQPDNQLDKYYLGLLTAIETVTSFSEEPNKCQRI